MARIEYVSTMMTANTEKHVRTAFVYSHTRTGEE